MFFGTPTLASFSLGRNRIVSNQIVMASIEGERTYLGPVEDLTGIHRTYIPPAPKPFSFDGVSYMVDAGVHNTTQKLARPQSHTYNNVHAGVHNTT